MTVPVSISRAVEARAAGRCEYCRMHQSLQGATFHVEHIKPRILGGLSTLDNLALACPACNLRKADRTQIVDQATSESVMMFNPRINRWTDHFAWKGVAIIGLSGIGRATIAALDLNHETRRRIRQAEQLFNLFPPPAN